MSQLEVEADIAADREETWRQFADARQMPKWVLGMRSLSLSPPEGGLGAERRLGLRWGATHRERITRWQPPAALALVVLEPPVFARSWSAEIALEARGAWTRVRWRMDYTLRLGVLGVLFDAGVLRPVLRSALRFSLWRLGRRLAAGASPGTPT